MNCRLAIVGVILLAFTSPAALAQPAWHTDVGYIQLLNEFGLVADGTGVVVAQVEAPFGAGGTFMPDATLSPGFDGKTFTPGSPGSLDPSNHATNVGRNFYSNNESIAPGITQITNFEANDWLGVKLGATTGLDPLPQNFAVSNHSYIGNGLNPAVATDILQRFDFAINQTGMTAVVGLNNGSANPQPQLLVHSYNAISVGRTDGDHSSGATTFYGVGRTKPDLVAPANSTSNATAIVSSGAAFLYDAANGSNATQPEALKAILMAGATKSEFLTWDRTPTRPIDEVFGAGEMNVYNSYRILAGGEQTGSTSEPLILSDLEGWDYNPAAAAGAPVYYDLVLSTAAKDFSIMLNWNIDVLDTDTDATFSGLSNLVNMDLRLYDSTGGFLNSLLDSSLSTVDNLEHIFVAGLSPGRYTIEVSSNGTHDYGIAWRVQAVPEPSQWLAMSFALAVMIGFVVRQRRLQKFALAKRRKS